MKRGELGGLTCSLAGALAEVGDAWSLLIVKELLMRNRRFDGVAAQTGIAESSLATRLKRLEKLGIVSRHAYQARPARYEYLLTAKGEDLWSVLIALSTWGDRWQGREIAPVTYGCRACGADARPHMACQACAAPLGPGKTVAFQSEAMQAERAERGL